GAEWRERADRVPVEGDQVKSLPVEGEEHRLARQPERFPEHPPAQVQLLLVLGCVDADEAQLLPAQMSSSSPSTSRARSMMNLKQTETSFPSRSLITRSVSSSLTMLTQSDWRRRGSSVVALRSSAGISPRPLNRVMFGLAFPFAFSFRMRSRSVSSIAQ